MGLTDLFKRGRSSVVLGPRTFTLALVGHGVEMVPRLPATIAHLVDGTIVVGPYDAATAKASGNVKNVLVRPGTPPTGALERRAITDNSIVTYSTAQRGSTQLVLGPGMQSYDDVLAAFQPMPHVGDWRLVTDNHEFTWPAGLTLRATGNLTAEHGPYEFTLAAERPRREATGEAAGRATGMNAEGGQLSLDGSQVNVINLYGPLAGDKIPAPEQLNAAGQTRIDADTLPGTIRPVKHYTFEGDASAQRYYYVHLDAAVIYLLRARASVDAAKTVFAAADTIARSLRPRF
jgi:hypothetical protein